MEIEKLIELQDCVQTINYILRGT